MSKCPVGVSSRPVPRKHSSITFRPAGTPRQRVASRNANEKYIWLLFANTLCSTLSLTFIRCRSGDSSISRLISLLNRRIISNSGVT